jgi:xanthosine utilization system XapX-like protein
LVDVVEVEECDLALLRGREVVVDLGGRGEDERVLVLTFVAGVRVGGVVSWALTRAPAPATDFFLAAFVVALTLFLGAPIFGWAFFVLVDDVFFALLVLVVCFSSRLFASIGWRNVFSP